MEENERSKKLNSTDLIKILIDKLEQLIRENEQLKVQLAKFKGE